MNSKLITKCQNETILELSPDNAKQFEMLEDFILRSNTEKKHFLDLGISGGEKKIKAAQYVGVIQLEDGSCIELLPRIAGVKKGDIPETRKVLFKMVAALFKIPFEENSVSDSEAGEMFLEFFISVFARECMKIIKSGLLSGYESIEENTTQVKGTILFAENNRRNLVHRERLYVRHDEFTPDRAENRLMKSTAAVMSKLSSSQRNVQNLKKIMSILDEVKLSDNYDSDFAKCMNSRNTKKYNAVLNIARLFLRSRRNSEYSGKFVNYALLFSMDDIFRAYAARLVKAEYSDRTVRTLVGGRYLCDEQQCFRLEPDIVVSDELNHAEQIIITRWKMVETITDIDPSDMCTLFAYAKKFVCNNAVLLLPENTEAAELPNGGEYTVDCQGTVNIRIRFIRLTD